MHQSKTNNIILLALLWVISVLPSSVVAAGLGQLNVSSAIGEPLKAHIELLSVTPAEMSTLKARIAPASAYAAQGLMRPALHSDIKINIAKRTNGKQFLRLQSNQAIEEPYLDMLVEVEWENGRVLRQYTALLDPPGYDRAVAVTQVQTPKVTAISKQQANNIAPIKEAKPSNTATPVKQKAAAEPVKTGDHLTRKGDTLSKIARRMKPEGVSLDQMLVALYDANKEAFVGGNMNRLKVGKIIQPPSAEALNAVTQQQATKKLERKPQIGRNIAVN